MTVAITAGLLVFGAVYLMMKREMLRVILGSLRWGTRAMSCSWPQAGPPAVTCRMAPPMTFNHCRSAAAGIRATAIVIAFSITIVMLVLAVTGNDDDDTAATAQEVQE